MCIRDRYQRRVHGKYMQQLPVPQIESAKVQNEIPAIKAKLEEESKQLKPFNLEIYLQKIQHADLLRESIQKTKITRLQTISEKRRAKVLSKLSSETVEQIEKRVELEKEHKKAEDRRIKRISGLVSKLKERHEKIISSATEIYNKRLHSSKAKKQEIDEKLFISDKQRERAKKEKIEKLKEYNLKICLLYTSPSPRDQRGSRMPSSA
eukprot:TRINITY_DN2744_c0_g1_i8.p2 TRINITY_DN2744_c0_g1~~TRINITY_DN2744_c0_g1_i8.p2  ORF type:complete len:219 (-),score=97.49 TRINITY_DN2744_c0_g1_i8:17-640(-)